MGRPNCKSGHISNLSKRDFLVNWGKVDAFSIFQKTKKTYSKFWCYSGPVSLGHNILSIRTTSSVNHILNKNDPIFWPIMLNIF